MKKSISVLTAFLLSISIFLLPVNIATANAVETDSGGATESTNNDNVSVTGTNDFGDLLGSELSEKESEQQENAGNNIFSVDIQDNTARVNFETTQAANVVIGIYDEDGVQMITSAGAEVSADDESVNIALDGDKMPEYFYLRAYLVGTENFEPLCTVYESPNYTKNMQEFFAKTTDNFDEEKVLNFDDSKDNNFAVYSDSTKIIEETEESNKITSIDNENQVYVIENIDSSVSSLNPGDVFVQKYGENEDLLIVKIAAISIDGTTATITGENTSMDEVFSYVKIDSTSDASQIEVDTSTMDPGLVFEGLDDSKSTSSGAFGSKGLSWENELSAERSFKYTFLDKKAEESGQSEDEFDKYAMSAGISGSLELKVSATVKYYLASDEKYIEFQLSTALKANVKISAEVKLTLAMGTYGVSPVPGVFIEFSPSTVLKANIKLDLSAEVKSSVGIRASSKTGITNISKQPEMDLSAKIEGSVYLGVSLCPKVKILHKNVAEASLTAEAGVEIKGTLKPTQQNNNYEHHDCKACLIGELNAKVSIKAEAKFVNKLKFTLDLIDKTFKLSDFYYSFDYNELGLGNCPHKSYAVTISVKNISGLTPIPNASVALNGTTYQTDANGNVSLYASSGNYTVSVAKEGFSSTSEYFQVEKNAKRVVVYLHVPGQSSGTGGGTGSTGGTGSSIGNVNANLDVSVKNVKFCHGMTAILTKNNTLYMCGDNRHGQIGNGSTNDAYYPIKIMDNVKTVSLSGCHTAAVTYADELYMWGFNGYGQVGNGGTTNALSPVKIMDNVKTVSLGDSTSYAVTNNGDLYAWGHNRGGQVGNGTTSNVSSPVRIMRNVSWVYGCGEHAAAITYNRDLYMWGYNYCGELGIAAADLNSSICNVPTKVLGNVKTVSLSSCHTAAVTYASELYVWGSNSYGQVGNGKTINASSPVHVMNNVKMVSLSDGHTAAVTYADELYVWGRNDRGQVGDGKTTNASSPVQIMNDVQIVSLGSHTSYAVNSDRNLYAWGYNGFGQVGNGTDSSDVLSPVKIMRNVSWIYGGFCCAAATTSDNGVLDSCLYTWGQGGNGQLGTGGNDTYSPVRISLSSAKTTSSSAALSVNKMTKEYEDLEPGGIYNFYVMKSRTDYEPFSSDNLYYIIQGVADEGGRLTITYIPSAEYETADRFISAMDKQSITLADVELSDLTYNGEEQYAEPTLVIGETELCEGIDYELSGEYTATEPGEYQLVINGKGKYAGTLVYSYTMNIEFRNLSELEQTTITLGDAVSMKANAVGGAGEYTYSYYFRQLSDFSWSIIDTDTENTAVSFEPDEVGTYYARVDITDKNGEVKRKAIKFTVEERKLSNLSSISDEKIYTGSEITLTGKAKGGLSPYQFAFSYKNIFDDKWIIKQGYSSNDTVQLKLDEEGDYDICIKVKDENDTISKKFFTVTVEKEVITPLKNHSQLSASTIRLGEKANVDLAAQGGKGKYEYAFYYKESSASSWTTLKEFSSAASVSFEPDKQTKYNICTKVRDERGIVVNKYFTLNVIAPLLTNTSTVSVDSIMIGEKFKVYASGRGGTAPYLYEISYKKSTDTKWAVKQNYSINTSVNIKPGAAATYNVRVNVKDDEGTIVSKTFNVKVKALPLLNDSTIDKTVIGLGETIKVTGVASGGVKDYSYEISYKKPGASDFTVHQSYSTTNTASIKFTSAGTYTVKVRVKDKNGTITGKNIKVKVNDALKNTSTISSTSIKLGEKVTVNASGTGGSEKYTYEVTYRKSSDSGWATKQKYGENATVAIKPAAATTYVVKVRVKDSNGTVVGKNFTVKVTK